PDHGTFSYPCRAFEQRGGSRRAQRLFVGLSDDRRLFVPVLVLFVVVVLVVIIVRISRTYRAAAHDGGGTPNVLGDPWRHFRSCADVATFTQNVSARERGRQSVCIAVLQYRRLQPSSLDRRCRAHTIASPSVGRPILPMRLA